MQVWTEFGDYLLGRYVLGVLGGVDGAAPGDAEWHIVLDYEHEIRRDMVRRMLTGTPLDQALRAAWADPVVKDRFLITPLQRRDLMGNLFADRLAVRARERCPRNVFDYGLASEREAVRRKTIAIARVISTMLTL